LEGKIEFILEAAALEASHDLSALAENCCAALVTKMQRDIHFYGSILVLNSIKKNAWFLQQGGVISYRAILDAVLASIEGASATDWLQLMKFLPNAMGWTADDQRNFDEGWIAYCGDGLDEEILNCSSEDEYSSLADSLRELSKFGTDFSSKISSLEESIVELSESEESLEEGNSPAPRAVRTTPKYTTDEDVRQMFHTMSES
jgi:hypothetical protein